MNHVKTYFWEEPYAFKLCTDNIMRRCVAGSETLEILAHCHSGPTGGHHSANVTANKVYESGFYWSSVFKDVNEDEFSFKVNGQRLKKYYGGDIDKEDDETVYTAYPNPMDTAYQYGVSWGMDTAYRLPVQL
ncbi:hypothetical protein Tco_0864428 [Tanacetum coccineum]